MSSQAAPTKNDFRQEYYLMFVTPDFSPQCILTQYSWNTRHDPFFRRLALPLRREVSTYSTLVRRFHVLWHVWSHIPFDNFDRG